VAVFLKIKYCCKTCDQE